MNGAAQIHSMTSLAPRAGQPRRGRRTNLWGGVVLLLAWTVLAGAFLLDVARPPPGARAWGSSAVTQAGALALARSSPPPCSP